MKPLECFWCDIPLQWNEENKFYRCPDCNSEWWPGEDNATAQQLWNSEQAYKRQITKPGGGSKSGGVKKPKKPLTTERYRLD